MLYQQVRPKKLADMLGNPAALAALRRAVAEDRRAHAYLFCGPAGCGKTTLARILAADLGCDPINILEINAASERGIEMARNLERRAGMAPLGGGCRAVILDEAHALTKDAMSALLKVLEDVPPWCYYMLCTTEPGKLLPTVVTRCERVEVRPLTPDELADLLMRTVEEQHAPDPGDVVLQEIARSVEGCPRRALVLLEQVAGLDEAAALELVASGEAVERELLELCRAVSRGQWREAQKVYVALPDRDPEKIRRGLLGYLRAVLIKATNDDLAGQAADKIEELAGATYDGGEAALIAMIFRACRV